MPARAFPEKLSLAVFCLATLFSVTNARADELTPAEANAPLAPAEAAPPARAAVPNAAPLEAPPGPPQVEWYGWQTLASDAAALALVGAGVATQDRGVGGAGLGLYLLGAPIAHAANGQLGKGAISVGLRATAPLVGGFFGAFFSLGCGDPAYAESKNFVCDGGLVGLGALTGAVGVMAADALMFAKKEARPRPTVSLAPSVLPTPRGAMLGLGGTF